MLLKTSVNTLKYVLKECCIPLHYFSQFLATCSKNLEACGWGTLLKAKCYSGSRIEPVVPGAE